MQKRIDFFGNFRPTGVDPTAGAQFRALAGLGGQVTDMATTFGIRAGQNEVARQEKVSADLAELNARVGQKQAFEDVQAGKVPQEQSNFTAYGQAYNKVAALAYEASVQQDTREKMAELSVKYADDPEAFKIVSDSYKEEVIKGLPPELAFTLGANIEASAFSTYDSLSKNVRAKQIKESVATIQSNLESNSVDILNAARDDQPQVLQEKIAVASKTLTEAVKAGLITEQQSIDYVAAQGKSIYTETVLGRFDRTFQDARSINDQIDSAKALIEEVAGTNPKGFKPDEVDRLVNNLNVKLNKKQSVLNAQIKVQETQARKAVANYENAVSLGIDVSEEQRSNVYQLAATNEDLTDRLALADRLSSFSVMSKSDRDAQLSNLENLTDVNEFAAAQKINQQLNKMAFEDGYALGVQQGIVDHEPLDINNPDSLAIRIEQSELLSEHYGVPVSPITKQEADGISAMIDETATVPEKIQIAKTLNQSPDVWKQIAESNQAAFSLAGASGDEKLMRAVFNGQELIKNKLASTPSSAAALPILNDYVGNVYGNDDKSAVMQAAIAHYASTSNDGGMFDPSAFEKSIEAVTGGIGKINGYKVQLPRGVDESDFEDFIDDMSVNYINSIGGIYGMNAEQSIEFIQQNTIISIGENKYTVQRGGVTPPSGANKSEPFTFSYDPSVAASSYGKVGRGR